MPNTISQNLARLQAARTAIAGAITEMGGTVNQGDGFEEFPADIRTIVSSDFEATLEVTAVAGATVTASKTGKMFTGVCNAQGAATLNILSPGTYTVQSSYSGALSDTQSVVIMTHQQTYTATNTFITLLLTAPNGSDVTITDGTTTITDTGTGSSVTYYLPNTGTWMLSAELGEDYTEYELEVDAYGDYTKELSFQVIGIWGVTWTGGSETTFTRTDDAALFSDPDPYVADGNHPGSSPFDDIMPWSGIRRVTIDGNELVEIPKFWFKVTKTGDAMTFQIADGPAEGFHVSPAHADRGDGVGERDYVYVGRYHCSSTDYKSTSGSSPKASITRSIARTNIHNLGSDYWLSDFAMFWTIRLLYLVEFADWDSQAVIGYGCGNDSSVVTMGYTDAMPYHTGTMASSRTTYAASTQYRYIEGIWDNVRDWCDGIRFSGSSVYTYLNPSTYSDSSGGTNTGTRPSSSGCIRDFGVPSATDYEWALYPSFVASDSSYSTYVADRCAYSSSGVVLFDGGSYYQGPHSGMFFLDGDYSASVSLGSIGARLQYLPG